MRQECRSAGVQETGVLEYWSAGVQESQNLEGESGS
jgi:hypothetical protein